MKNSYSKEYRRAAFLKSLIDHPLCYICNAREHAPNDRRCHECRSEYMKKRRELDAGGWYKRLTPEKKEKRRARAVIYSRIKRGKMERHPCEICGNPKSEKHHYAGYSKDKAAIVRDLCKMCHILEDKKSLTNPIQ